MPYTIVTRRVTVHRKTLPTFKRGRLPVVAPPLRLRVYCWAWIGLPHSSSRSALLHSGRGHRPPRRLQNDYCTYAVVLAGGRRPCLAGHNGCAFLAPVPDNDVGGGQRAICVKVAAAVVFDVVCLAQAAAAARRSAAPVWAGWRGRICGIIYSWEGGDRKRARNDHCNASPPPSRRRMRYPFSNRVPLSLSLPRFHHLSYAYGHSGPLHSLHTPFAEEDRMGGKTPLRGGRDSEKDVDGEGLQLTHLFEFLPGVFLLALSGCSRVQSVEAS